MTSLHGRTSILVGVAFTVTMRWTDRLVGILSTFILARLLVPDDFGIIAMASVVVGLVDAMLDLGVNVALVQNRNATQAHYDTAWTLQLLQHLAVAAIIIAAAPLAGSYFGDDRVVPVLRAMSIGLVISSLENIGVVAFQKNMQFGLEFRLMFIGRIISFVATVVAAWTMQSYWALVIGALVSRALRVCLSYVLHPMRPRWSFEKCSEIFSISQWMLVRTIGSYFDGNLHKILVGRRSDAAAMGGYTLADQIAALPSTDLLAPVNRVLFPAFVNARHNLQELKRLLLLAQGVQALIAVPAGVGLAMMATEAVPLLLGEKWTMAIPFVQLLALGNIAYAITNSCINVMWGMGRVRSVALLGWARAALFVGGILFVVPAAGPVEIAGLRVATVLCGLALSVGFVMRVLRNIKLRDIVAVVSRPLVGAAVMAGAIYICFMDSQMSLLYALILKILLASVSYVGTVLLLWWLSGMPDGTESYLIGKVRTSMNRLRSRTA